MLKACAVCGTPSLGTRCARHQRELDIRHAHRGQITGRDTHHWQQLRRQRLELAGYRCELQIDEGCTGLATSVHLAPELNSDHRRATLADCRAACAHCHAGVDAPRRGAVACAPTA